MAKPAPDAPTGAVPDTICPMPWINLSLDVDGTTRPCCKFAHLTPESPYQMARLPETTLADAWNSPAMQKLRADFRAGDKPADCQTCWSEEDAGIRSWRQTFMDDRQVHAAIDYDTVTPEQPLALDFKLSNSCNLKCRICGPVASSLWLTEELASTTGDHRNWLADNRSLFRSNKITQVEGNAEAFRQWVPLLQHLEMTGGEPMFSAENREVIDLIVSDGQPDKVSLLLTTNAMVIDQRILANLPRFANVSISLSIDDIGPRLEYERAPAEWATVVANIATYQAMAGPRFQLYINCSVSTLNAWYMPEMVDWVVENLDDTKILLHLNMVHGPRYYNVQVMPGPLKAELSTRLRDAAAARGRNHYLSGQLEQLASFIEGGNADGEPDQWRLGWQTTAQRDAIRGESYAAAFPEFVAACERLGVWPDPAQWAQPDHSPGNESGNGAGGPAADRGSPVRWLGRQARKALRRTG